MKHYVILTLGILFIGMSFATTVRAEMEVTPGKTFTTKAAPLDVALSADGKWTMVLAKGGKLFVYNAAGSLNDIVAVDPSMDRVAASSPANSIYRVYLSSRKTKKVQELLIEPVADINIAGAPFLGKINAPVTIVVFSDFECPYCSKIGPLLEQALERNPDTVKIVFKHFPLSFHKSAEPAARAAIAAQAQGKFWEFHDLLFANGKNLSHTKIDELAKRLQLDMARFKKDMSSQPTRRQLAQDYRDGQSIGVRGTPAIFVNGLKLKKRSIEGVEKQIHSELAKKK